MGKTGNTRPERPPRGRLERGLLIGTAFGIVILAGIGWMYYRFAAGFVDTSAWIEATHRTLYGLSELRTHLAEIEAASSGYVLTGRDEYLVPLKSGLSHLPSLRQELQLSVSGSRQNERLTELHKVIDEWVSLEEAVIAARGEQGIDAARGIVEQGRGKRLTDEVRLLLNDMETSERQALAERGAGARLIARRTSQAMSGIILVSALLLVLSAFVIRRSFSERRRQEQDLSESREALQDFLDNAHDMIQSVAPDGRYLYVNRKWLETLGFTREEAARLTLQQVIHPGRWQEAQAVLEEALRGRPVESFETVFVAKDGRQVTVEGSISVRTQNGVPTATRGIYRDITEHRQSELEMRQSNEMLLRSVRELEQRSREIADLSEMSDLLQSCQTMEEAYKVISSGIASIIPADAGAMGIISSSRNVVEVVTDWGTGEFGERVFEPEDCWALRRGRMNLVEDLDSAMRCPHAGAAPAPYACIPLVAQGEALGLLHLRPRRQAGDLSLDFLPGRQQLLRTLADRIALAIANLRLREVLRQQSVRDPLTGLFNRRYMEESLEREIRRAVRSGRPLGILMLDLDHFKLFNDTHGHTAGDALLREFAAMLGSSIRAGDIACRYGGEEFAVILPDAPREVTQRRAEQLREKTRRLMVQHRGLSLGSLTVSIGVSAFPVHGATTEELLRAADAALYGAKHAGRDRVQVAEAAIS